MYLKKAIFSLVKIQKKKSYFHCLSAFSIDFSEPTSDFQMPVSTYLYVGKNSKCGYSFS